MSESGTERETGNERGKVTGSETGAAGRPPTPILPPLPYADWLPTKTTLHLYCQIVGKVRLALMPPLNHWWHVTLYPSARGLTTRSVPDGRGGAFEIVLDLVDHRLEIETSRGDRRSFPLAGQPVADFHRQLFAALGELGVEAAIDPRPFDMGVETPFAADREHHAWDRDAIARFWRVLLWSTEVIERFAGRFAGKATPVHLFWHSFDLAYTRFSGRRAPEMPDAGRVSREAYSHEVVSFGFWPGDESLPEPAYYSYVWPVPEGVADRALRPAAAEWSTRTGSPQALLRYAAVSGAERPEAALLEFLESAYAAQAEVAGWPVEELTRGG